MSQPTGNHLTRFATTRMYCNCCPYAIEVGDEMTLEPIGWAHWQCPEITEEDDD